MNVLLVIAFGIVHKENYIKNLRSHGTDLRGNATILKQKSSFLCIPQKSMIKRFHECFTISSTFIGIVHMIRAVFCNEKLNKIFISLVDIFGRINFLRTDRKIEKNRDISYSARVIGQ